MKKILIPIIVFSALAATSCLPMKKMTGNEIKVSPLSDTSLISEGALVYTLPRTVFAVKVVMEHTIEIPGPYARYAGELLGLKNIITAENESWSISRIGVNSYQEADPSEYYVIRSNNVFATNILELKKEGLILDLNPAFNYQEEKIIDGKEVNINEFRSFDLGSDEYYITQTDTAYRRINVDSAFIRIPYIVEKKKQLSTDQLAERAAHRLMEIREGKFMILTGEANVFPQDEASINALNKMEKDYIELFTGKTFRQERTFVYHFIPDRTAGPKPVILFRFSEVTGPSGNGSDNGDPISISLVPEQKTKDLTYIPGNVPSEQEVLYDKIYYRVPDVVNVKISAGNKTLYNSRKLIYQFGEILQMPSNYLIGK